MPESAPPIPLRLHNPSVQVAVLIEAALDRADKDHPDCTPPSLIPWLDWAHAWPQADNQDPTRLALNAQRCALKVNFFVGSDAAAAARMRWFGVQNELIQCFVDSSLRNLTDDCSFPPNLDDLIARAVKRCQRKENTP